MKEPKCLCGSFFCTNTKPDFICMDCKKKICKSISIFCNIDKKRYCVSCYIKSFWDSLDKKDTISYNDLVILNKKHTKKVRVVA